MASIHFLIEFAWVEFALTLFGLFAQEVSEAGTSKISTQKKKKKTAQAIKQSSAVHDVTLEVPLHVNSTVALALTAKTIHPLWPLLT